MMLFRDGTLASGDFSTTESGCLLGKAGRSRYYAAYETRAETFRRELEQAVRDIAHAVAADPVLSLIHI